jgi:hypothetical protein
VKFSQTDSAPAPGSHRATGRFDVSKVLALTGGERLILARSPLFFHYVKLCVQNI